MSDPSFWQGPTVNVPVVNADGNIFEEAQVATAAQTVFTLLTFTYTPNTHSIFVYRKTAADAGVGCELLRRGVDYTETASNKITLAAGAVAGDILIFIAYAIQQIIPPIVFNGMPAGGTAGQFLTKIDSSDYTAQWANPSSITTLLDAARVNVASASTVNLTPLAATTRNIQITGSVQIDGFQVANGELWAVRFAASLILKNNANIVTQAAQDIKVTPGDTCIIRATADNVVEILSYARSSSSMAHNWNSFRLTLSSGLPVPTGDVAASATLYCTPYMGDKISLFNGTSWVVRESAEFSLAIAGLTILRPYDVFCFDNAGIPALEVLAWTSATVRATALVTQDGVLVKSGDATRKYLGTVVPTAANALTDTARQRLVWNYYNRVIRDMLRFDTTNYSYNGAYRQAAGNVLNQLEVVSGVQEDSFSVTISAVVSSTTAAGATQFSLAVGEDSIAVSASCRITDMYNTGVSFLSTLLTRLTKTPSAGYHYYTWLEFSSAATTNWFGEGGMLAQWRC